MNNLRNKKRNTKGAAALEAIIGGTALLMIMVMMVGYFTYLFPRYTLDVQVQNISNTIRLNGGLDWAEYQAFTTKLEKLGYTADDINLSAAELTALKTADEADDKTVSGLQVYKSTNTTTDGTPIDASELIETSSTDTLDNAERAHRGEENIVVRLVVPANKNLLKGGMSWFGAMLGEGMNRYEVERVVMSEIYSKID